jgi:hypothetical protein
MNLLSTSDLIDINNAFKDLRDTFLQSIVIYHVLGERLDRFMEDTELIADKIVNLPVLIVPSKMGKVEILQKGKQDFTESYVLVFWEDLVNTGLADTNAYFLQADKDFMVINGEKVDVIGVNKVPDLGNLKNYVKIQYRKKLAIEGGF